VQALGLPAGISGCAGVAGERGGQAADPGPPGAGPREAAGGEKGAAQIRAHPFFADIDWALIRHKVSAPPRPACCPPAHCWPHGSLSSCFSGVLAGAIGLCPLRQRLEKAWIMSSADAGGFCGVQAVPAPAVPVKLITTEADSARQSITDEELDWDENEARPSESLDYGY